MWNGWRRWRKARMRRSPRRRRGWRGRRQWRIGEKGDNLDSDDVHWLPKIVHDPAVFGGRSSTHGPRVAVGAMGDHSRVVLGSDEFVGLDGRLQLPTLTPVDCEALLATGLGRQPAVEEDADGSNGDEKIERLQRRRRWRRCCVVG